MVDKQDEQGDILEQIAGQLAKAALDKKNRSAILKEVEGTLSKITIADAQELADSPAIQAFIGLMGIADLKPGEIKNKGTLAERTRDWNENDMREFPTKTFEPRETVPVIFNGLTYQLVDGQEVTVPEPIWNIYREHERAVRQAKIHEDFMLGYSNQPPDSSWLAPDSAKVRAFSQMGPAPDARQRGVGLIPLEDGGSDE